MKVIGIAGKAGSGKNTVAGILAGKLVDMGHPVVVDAFAVIIKRTARDAGWDGEKTPEARRKLQQIGAHLREKDPDSLIDLLNLRNSDLLHYIIVPDVRMKNEVEYCRQHGVLWHVFDRGGLDGDLGEDVTETNLDDLANDLSITSIRNDGTLEELTQLVHMAVADGRHDKDLIEASTRQQ